VLQVRSSLSRRASTTSFNGQGAGQGMFTCCSFVHATACCGPLQGRCCSSGLCLMAMPGAASEGSLNSSWIGTFTRNVSGTLSSRSISQGSEQLGVELTLRSGDTVVPGSQAAAVSQPIDIRGPGNTPAGADGVRPDGGIIVQVRASGATSEPASSDGIGEASTSNGTAAHSTAPVATSAAGQRLIAQLHQQPEQQSMTR
jgi:hypothetical protein